MLKVTEIQYQKLIDAAVKTVRAQKSPETKDVGLFSHMNSLPTIKELEEHGITPNSAAKLDMNILAYLVFYTEEYCVDKENEEYEYIFSPDPRLFTREEISEFEETRKYMQKVLIKAVEIR